MSVDSVPVLLLGFVAFPAGLNVPGGTLIMLPGVPVLLFVGGAFGPNGANTPVGYPFLKV